MSVVRNGRLTATFIRMNELIHEMLAEEKIAIELEETALMDKDGDVAKDERLMHGLPCEHEILEPQNFLFVDEVGSDLDSNDDHDIGGEKFVNGVEKDHATTR